MRQREAELGGSIRDIAQRCLTRMYPLLFLATVGLSIPSGARQVASNPVTSSSVDSDSSRGEPSQDYNQRIAETVRRTDGTGASSPIGDYQIGPEDLLEISVLDAPDLSRTVRVSDDGAISLPLLGSIDAAGLSTRELEAVLKDLLKRTYMKDPQVSVFVQEMRSHSVSVFGAVEKPGVYQIRDAKTLIEILSMAQGLANDAGDTVIIVRRGGDSADAARPILLNARPTGPIGTPSKDDATSETNPPSQGTGGPSASNSMTINLKDLLDSSNPHSNVLVYPGDAVKVTRAGIVYVVGEVHKPGGFVLKTNENVSVLQAVALAEGTTPTSNTKQARIILAGGGDGSRPEIPINLDKILAGQAPDPLLKPDDVLFIPNSSGKAVLHGLAQSSTAIVAAVSGAAVYSRW
jgi:polysaccharide biosynthesis/export protein